jgi:putative SOS response-associated peptidase YedK
MNLTSNKPTLHKRMPIILTPQTEKLWMEDNDVMQFAMPDINLKAVAI